MTKNEALEKKAENARELGLDYEPEQEPVAWVGLDLDNMAEAFHRVIEEHHSRKNPFHDPVNGDAMIALRELRGLIAYMKRNTTPPQRTWVGLTDREVELIDGMIEVQMNHAEQCARIANRTMAEKQKGWDMERVELLRKLKEKNT